MRRAAPRRGPALSAALAAGLLLTACESLLLDDDPPDTPESNFELLWTEFDLWYAGFGSRGVDWDELYASYRPRVTSGTSREELWTVVTGMLSHLDDLHTTLEDPQRRLFFQSSNPLGLPNPRIFDAALVRERYLDGQVRFAGDGRMMYGAVADGVGYVHIADFEDGDGTDVPGWAHQIDAVVEGLGGVSAMIVDVRQNPGGTDPASHRIAGAFADQRRLAYTVQTRNGPAHDDFDAPKRWHVEPLGSGQLVVPTVLLTDHRTSSAAEIFSLLMTALPHVTHVGGPTGGGFSDGSFARYLPNGWVYQLSHQLYLAPDGRSPEGVGVVPDVVVINSEAEIAQGFDRTLEEAIDLLRR